MPPAPFAAGGRLYYRATGRVTNSPSTEGRRCPRRRRTSTNQIRCRVRASCASSRGRERRVPRHGPSRRLVPNPFDFMESKVRIPAARPGSVTGVARRHRHLRTATTPIAVVTAPAGYGKSTLLAQWSARDPRPFAWVTLDERDDDPAVMLQHLAVAVDRVEPVGACVLEAPRPRGRSVWRCRVSPPRVGAAD